MVVALTTEAMVGSGTAPTVAAALEVEEMVKSFVNLPAPGTTEGKGGGGEERGGEDGRQCKLTDSLGAM